MRFKVDENLPTEVALRLRWAGHDAATVREQAMTGEEDPELLDVCKRENRVMVTLDLDFSNIRTYAPSLYPGLIVLRVGRQGKRHVLSVFEKILPLLEREPLAGYLWIVDETRVRIRGGADATPPSTDRD